MTMRSIKRHKHRRLSRLELKLSPMAKLATGDKGKPHRKIVGAKIKDGREYLLHATKGYRSSGGSTEE